MDREFENILRAEAASMTDDEVIAQFRRKDWDDETKQILAEDIAERIELNPKSHNPYLDALRELTIEARKRGDKELANSIYGIMNRVRSDADQIEPEYDGDRLIPKDKVWKFVFEVSHAPQYIRQFENGSFAAIYAPVENVDGTPGVPIGLSREKVVEVSERDYVNVIEQSIDQSPWAEGVYL